MTDLEFHPLANVFPLMEGADFRELVEDIREHGLREPIVVHEGMILDGRNRFRACHAAQAEARFEVFVGVDPLAYVVSINLRRRHLNESQRADVGANLATLRRGDNQHTAIAGTSVGRAAELLNVSEDSIERAKVVRAHGAPELVAKVQSGRVSVSAAADVARLPQEQQRVIVAKGEAEILAAAKDIRTKRAEARKVELAAQKAALADLPRPAGKYDVLVLDPPWAMEKLERDARPQQVAFDYPTMSEEELAAFDVPAMAAEDCHLFCWTTQKFLPMSLRLIEAWGFRYCLTMVWHKPGGFQPFGLPQYNCEFIVYARRGAPDFVDTKAFPTCFQAPRREHSRKPDEFYDLVRRVTAGRRIEVFSREAREGFAQYGDEADKFQGAA